MIFSILIILLSHYQNIISVRLITDCTIDQEFLRSNIITTTSIVFCSLAGCVITLFASLCQADNQPYSYFIVEWFTVDWDVSVYKIICINKYHSNQNSRHTTLRERKKGIKINKRHGYKQCNIQTDIHAYKTHMHACAHTCIHINACTNRVTYPKRKKMNLAEQEETYGTESP